MKNKNYNNQTICSTDIIFQSKFLLSLKNKALLELNSNKYNKNRRIKQFKTLRLKMKEKFQWRKITKIKKTYWSGESRNIKKWKKWGINKN